jgi:hypothetical protein
MAIANRKGLWGQVSTFNKLSGKVSGLESLNKLFFEKHGYSFVKG